MLILSQTARFLLHGICSQGKGDILKETLEFLEVEHSTAPFIIFGRDCVGRIADVRSDQRVLTHVIVWMNDNALLPNLRQLIMRCLGRSRKVSRVADWPHVVVTSHTVTDLYTRFCS